MDDLVLIIVTLIIVVAGVFGQVKKKKQIPVTGGEQKNPEDFWDLFRDEPVAAPQPKAKPEYSVVEVEKSVPNGKVHDYKFYSDKEGGRLIVNEPKMQPPAEKIITKKKEKFPLRKAVIYSEIINRKY